MDTINSNASIKSALIRPLFLLIILMVCFVLIYIFDMNTYFLRLIEHTRNTGILGMIAMGILFILAIILAVPGSVLTAIAGIALGSVKGILFVIIVFPIGASIPFLISRYLIRQPIYSYFSNKPKFCQLEKWTEKNGSQIVILTRLIPIFPFNILNYALGLTSVRFKPYLFYTFICLIPITVFLIVGSDLITNMILLQNLSFPLLALLITSASILVIIIRKSTRRLKRIRGNIK